MISVLKNQPGKEQRFSYAFILIFVILAATIVTAGYFYYWNYAKHYRSEIEHRISAIAELKKNDLVLWRKERIADATFFYKNAVFSALAQRYFKKPEDADTQNQLQVWLHKVQESDQYARVFLLDERGIVRMAFPEAPMPVASIPTQRISETLRSGQVTFVDFYRNNDTQRIYLAVLVPILDGQDGKQNIGILALLIDPEQYLYPYIHRWPTTDKTAETLLIRRDSNDVLFLNKLKFDTNTTLSMRIPLTNTALAAVKAIMGKEGLMEAVDYRGVSVLADVHAIPDSPWFMVTRIDISEIYAPLRERLWLIFAIVGILLILVGLSLGLIQRQQKVRFYLMQYEIMKKMHESEEDLAITLRSIGDAVIATDEKGRITRMNPVAETLTGWPLSEASGKPLEEVFRIINAQTRAPVQNPITKVLTDGKVVGLANHTALIARDGNVRQIADSAAPIRDMEGRICGVVLVFHDVTAEYKLREQSLRLAAIVESSEDAIIGKNLDGTILSWNQGAEKIYGYSGSEIIGRNIGVLLPPGQNNELLELLAKLRRGENIPRYETKRRRKDGKTIAVAATFSPIKDAAGNIIGASTIARDITERKRMEIELAKHRDYLQQLVKEKVTELTAAQHHYQELFDNITICLCRTTAGPQGAFVDVNPAMVRTFEADNREQLMALHPNEIYLDQSQRNIVSNAIMSKGFIDDEIWFKTLKGRPICCHITAGKKIEENGQVYFDNTLENITERKQMEEKIKSSEKLAVIGQLASSVAHELRNPLGVMKNVLYYLNMLGLGKDNSDIKENLGIIATEIENSDKIISDLLEFSRIKPPALKPEEINLIIKETLNRVTVPAGIKVVTELGENLPQTQMDALQIQQVFYNLASNAIQAMEKGGTLTISTRKQRAENGEQIEIAFQDTGVGIPKENLQKIFEPLFSTKTKGTGLGLSVVTSLVEGHDGKLEVKSEVGKGSIFTVKLPIK